MEAKGQTLSNKSALVYSTIYCTAIQCPLRKHHLSTLGLTFKDVLDCDNDPERIKTLLDSTMKERMRLEKT